jgi:phosphoglycerate dehydrogenase-like enzyme
MESGEMNPPPTVLALLDTNEQVMDHLRAACAKAEFRVGPHLAEAGQTVAKELLQGVDCVLCEQLPGNFDDFDRLQWIQLSSAGYSQIFGLPLVERGIRVTNGRGNFDIPIAEWNVLMMLLWHRHLIEMIDHQRQQIWDRSARFQTELRGAVIGLYGYGGLARETARLAKSMGLVVWALTRDGAVKPRDGIYCVPGTGDPEGVLCDRVFGPEGKAEFLAGLDYLILAMPITPATQGIIGEAELRMLRPSAVLINPARATLVDEAALVQCLTEGWIRGASFDVHYAYPLPAGHPVWTLPNMVLTPHISGSNLSPHFLERIYDIFAQNLQRFCGGQPLWNELTTAQIQGG